MNITIASAVSDQEVLEANLLASPALRENVGHEILLQRHFASATQAYNDAIGRSSHDVLLLVHQDVYLPSGWFDQLEMALRTIEKKGRPWGVLGCWGVTQEGLGHGHVYSPGIGIIGGEFEAPVEVQTLDEIVLVTRKSIGLRFDDGLRGFHLYGVDLCMAALSRGLSNFAISAFCVHNSNYLPVLPDEYYDAYRHVKRRWRRFLPIHTSCIRITRFDGEMRRRRFLEAVHRFRGRPCVVPTRAGRPDQLLRALGHSGHMSESGV